MADKRAKSKGKQEKSSDADSKPKRPSTSYFRYQN